jgi:phage-related protein
MDKTPSLKPLYWVGSSKRDLLSSPGPAADLFGFALYLAQDGRKHEQADIDLIRERPKAAEQMAKELSR